MVTDEEYNNLVKRVDDLEEKLLLLAKQYSALYMKNDLKNINTTECTSNKKHRDITRYKYRDEEYCKRQLVLQCVKTYAFEKNAKLSQEIKDAFPDYIQGSLGVVKLVGEAEVYSGAAKRFFFSDNDVLHFEDGDMVVCSQWDAKNINRFIRVAEELGMEITPIERRFI